MIISYRLGLLIVKTNAGFVKDGRLSDGCRCRNIFITAFILPKVKKALKIILFLFGIISIYCSYLSLPVDFTVVDAQWIALPNYNLPFDTNDSFHQ